MKVAAALVSLVAIATIVGSAFTVINRDYEPRLSVNVTGVPGYVYYDRAYDLSIEYANDGGAIYGPVQVTVQLPETFALAEHVGDAARRGERLIWTLDGLDAGERGSLPLTVRGVLPEDLTNAVYDLPGYVGHTAFVEGFDLGVTLTAGDASASTLAVADTGQNVNTLLTVIKDCGEVDSNQTFSFSLTGPSGAPGIPPVPCGESESVNLDVAARYFLQEDPQDGWTPVDITTDGCVTGSLEGASGGAVAIHDYFGPVDGSSVGADFSTGAGAINRTITCTFANTPDPASLIIVKVCDPEDLTQPFSFNVEPQAGIVLTGECALVENDSSDFFGQIVYESGPLLIQPFVEYTVTESLPEGYDTPTFEGDCSSEGGNSATLTADPGELVYCIVTNTLLEGPGAVVPLTIVKDCGGDTGQEVFTLVGVERLPEVDATDAEWHGETIACDGELNYDLQPQGNYDLSEDLLQLPVDWVFDGVECFEDDTDPEDRVKIESLGESGVNIVTPASDAIEGQTVRCVFTNIPPTVLTLAFQKYTTLEDEVVFLAEPFSWYIDVPAQEGYWTLIDVLPLGIGVVTVFDPDGVECIPYAIGIICFGGPSEEWRTIEIIALGAPVCGDYYNVAKLITGLHSWQYADDTVTVCGPEQEEELPPEETSFGLFSSGQSWWSRLWLSLFAR